MIKVKARHYDRDGTSMHITFENQCVPRRGESIHLRNEKEGKTIYNVHDVTHYPHSEDIDVFIICRKDPVHK